MKTRKYTDLTGKIFGKLLVLKESPEKGKRNQRKWICKCICEKEIIVYGERLRNSRSRSCGCFRREPANKIKDRKGVIYKDLYNFFKRQSLRRGIGEVQISFDDFKEVISSPCFYCDELGASCSKDHSGSWYKRKGSTKQYVSDTILSHNGVDRVSSSLGYTKDNIVPCCKRCNYAKNTLTQEEFKTLIIKIYNKFCKN